MAQSDENLLIRGFHGKVGNQVVFRRWNGKTILCNTPRKHKDGVVGKQVASCERFRMAQEWAKRALKDPQQYAAYKATATGLQSALNVAVSDYMRPPVVTGINTSFYHGSPGDLILVTATDNFGVKEVSIRICTTEGKLIERGVCSGDPSGSYWHYSAVNPAGTVSGVTITATAMDNPGNTGKMTVTLE